MEQSEKYRQLSALGPHEPLAAEDTFGLIEITGVPDGFPPLEIRRRWIGVRMRCVSRVVSAEGPSGELGPGFVVFQRDAVDALRAHDAEAAKWFRQHGFPQQGATQFHFCESCAREVEPCLWAGEFEQLMREMSR